MRCLAWCLSVLLTMWWGTLSGGVYHVSPVANTVPGTQLVFSGYSQWMSEWMNGWMNELKHYTGSRETCVVAGECMGKFLPLSGCISLPGNFSRTYLLVLGRLGGSVGWASNFGLGHDLTVLGFEPRVGLCAPGSEPGVCFGFCVFLSLSAPTPLSLSLSQK